MQHFLTASTPQDPSTKLSLNSLLLYHRCVHNLHGHSPGLSYRQLLDRAVGAFLWSWACVLFWSGVKTTLQGNQIWSLEICSVVASNRSLLKGTRNPLLFGFKYRLQSLRTTLQSLGHWISYRTQRSISREMPLLLSCSLILITMLIVFTAFWTL